MNLNDNLIRLYSKESWWVRLFVKGRLRLLDFWWLAELTPKRDQILEIGCGVGLYTQALALKGRGMDIIGIDPNPRACVIARRVAQGGRLKIEYFDMDLSKKMTGKYGCSKLSFQTFDVVSLIDSLHHIPRRYHERLMGVIYDALKPGGVVILKDIDEGPWWMVWLCWAHDLLRLTWPRFLTNRGIQDLLTKAGFEIHDWHRKKSLYVPHVAYIGRKN